MFDLTVRLTRGERIELTDGDGRRWRATHDALVMALPHSREFGCVTSGSTYEIAVRLAALLDRRPR